MKKLKVKCKWGKSDSDGQETGQATKHQCSEEKKSVKSLMEHSDAEEDIKPATSVSASAVMEFPSISTNKQVTMAADDFKSLMDFVRYIK